MSPNSHQTVRIARGRHRSPDEGACVMELASMLAGEEFTDHPKCVDPVLAAFLRSFNDRLSHADRQRLYPYAARAVGTRGDRKLARRRRDMCLEFAGLKPGLGARVKVAFLLRARLALHFSEGAGSYAARQAIARHRVEAGFALVERMLGPSEARPPDVPATSDPTACAPLALGPPR